MLTNRFTGRILSNLFGPMVQSARREIHYMLGQDLRIQSAQKPGPALSDLTVEANQKHVATFHQPVSGPLEKSTFEAMATDVHLNRPGKKLPTQNSVAIYNENSLPTSTTPQGGKKVLDTSPATVVHTQYDPHSKSVTGSTFEPGRPHFKFNPSKNDHWEK